MAELEDVITRCQPGIFAIAMTDPYAGPSCSDAYWAESRKLIARARLFHAQVQDECDGPMDEVEPKPEEADLTRAARDLRSNRYHLDRFSARLGASCLYSGVRSSLCVVQSRHDLQRFSTPPSHPLQAPKLERLACRHT
jgi:hypothetical protein